MSSALGQDQAGARTMARRPFLTSFSALASEFRLAGSKGKESRKPDCGQALFGQHSSQFRSETHEVDVPA